MSAETPMQVGRIDLGPTEPRHLTRTEQRVMDAALRRVFVRPEAQDDDPAKLARELRELHDGIRNAARENGSRLTPAFTHAMRDRIDRLCAALGVDTQ